MSIDWSKAPEDATHYDDRQDRMGGFMRLMQESDEIWMYWTDSGWQRYGAIGDYCLMSERPRPWTGEGLPPVGTVCDWQHHQAPPAGNSEWHVGDIRYISDCTVIIGGEGCEHVHHPRNCSFRPLRTAEQIAAEERDRGVEEIRQLLISGAKGSIESVIYDAGYRKQVQP
ncbi:hypothetical protein LZ023_26740 [Pseudomonas silvicola]|nr:hypothetical protein LZ023_26740 [Pseudomonas silvicola]